MIKRILILVSVLIALGAGGAYAWWTHQRQRHSERKRRHAHRTGCPHADWHRQLGQPELDCGCAERRRDDLLPPGAQQ